jgi:hypothetical protein
MKYWKCPQNPDYGFDEFVQALRFLSGLDSHSDTDSFSYFIRFVLYPYRNTGFEYGKEKPHRISSKCFPSILWFPPITKFMVITYSGWDYHEAGEAVHGIRTVSANLIMKRICLYYSGKLEYEYGNTVQCDWSRMWITNDGSYYYTMMPDRICCKK